MSSWISELDCLIRDYGEHLEAATRGARSAGFPQYKYFTYPLYKSCIRKLGELGATVVTFVVTDLIIHQLAPQAMRCGVRAVLYPEEECSITYSWKITAAVTTAFAMPTMYAKYRRRQELS